MSAQRSSRLTARSREATQEEAAATVRERAQTSSPPTKQGRGVARTSRVSHGPIGQVVEGEDKEIRWSKKKKMPAKKKQTKT